MGKYVNGALVDDAGIGTKSVNSSPSGKYLGEAGGQLSILADVAWHEHERSSQLLCQAICKGLLTGYIERRDIPTTPRELECDALPDAGLCKQESIRKSSP